MQDPCTILENLDLSKNEDLQQILLRDKHTRIEGLFTEVFFYEELLKDFSEYSTGWWFSFKNGNYNITKFCFSITEVGSFDFDLLEHFALFNSNVFIVEFNERDKDFYYAKYEKGGSSTINEYWDRAKKKYPKSINKAPMPLENERNQKRIAQAIQYLMDRNVLKKCAIERLFANCWLGQASYWDIDFFVKYNNTIVAFEVKQKFPTAKGTWGLNVGLAKLFIYLNTLNITVVHVILTKPVNDIRIPAIDLYTKEEFKRNAKWIATKFSDSLLNGGQGVAPKYTSIHGSSNLNYYHLANDSFTTIKEVASDYNKLQQFLKKTC